MDEWSAAPRLSRLLVIAQVVLIVAAGVLAAVEHTPFSVIDERPHFDYVQYVAQDGRLPVLGVDRIHPEVAAIAGGRYPRRTPIPEGLAGESYEAFQPPLYYLLVAPAWYVTPNHLHKVGAVRMVGVGFLVAALVVLAALCRAVVGREWPVALGFAGLTLLAPGVLMRSVTVGNAALEPLVATGFVLAAVMAWKRRSYRWLAVAGAALGACLLTRLVLAYLVPVLLAVGLGVWLRRGRVPRDLARVLVAFVVPVVLLTPWLAFNRHHYGAWTANDLARAMQEPVVDPEGVDAPLWGTLREIPRITDFVVPQEWALFAGRYPYASLALDGLRIVMIPLVGVFLVVLGRRALRGGASLICLAPLVLAVLALYLSTVITDWEQTIPRYAFGALPAFAVGGGCVYRTLLPRTRDFSRFATVLTVVTGFAVVQLFWAAFVSDAWTVGT